MSSHVMWRMSRFLTYEHILEDTQAGMEKLMDLFDALPYGSISFSKGLGPGASEWALKEQDKTAMPPRQVRINLAVKILLFEMLE